MTTWPGPESGTQDLHHVREEDVGVGRLGNGHWRFLAARGQGGQEGEGLPMTLGCGLADALPAEGAAIVASHVGGGARLYAESPVARYLSSPPLAATLANAAALSPGPAPGRGVTFLSHPVDSRITSSSATVTRRHSAHRMYLDQEPKQCRVPRFSSSFSAIAPMRESWITICALPLGVRAPSLSGIISLHTDSAG